MSKIFNPPKVARALSHEENRSKICLLCLKKNNVMFKIEASLQSNLEKLLKHRVDNILCEERLPNVLCAGCKRNVYRQLPSADPGIVPSKTVELPDYSKFLSVSLTTRSRTQNPCQCYLCQIARSNVISMQLLNKKKSADGKCIKRCSKCFIVPKRGTPHKCTKTAQVDNVCNYINTMGEKVMEQVASTLISKIAIQQHDIDDKVNKKDSTVSLTQARGGNSMKLFINPHEKIEEEPASNISTADFLKIKTKFNLSTKTTLGIATGLRVATKKRAIIELGLKKSLEQKNGEVKSFFCAKTIDFVTIKARMSTPIQCPIVYCHTLEDFLSHIEKQRDIRNQHLKFGIDGGGGFLKVCLSVQDDSTEICQQEKKRQKYDDGVFAKAFADSGVKKIFILAIVKSAQENYENVSAIWKILKIEDFSGTIATDLKLANILTGIMSHSSTYPCTWCLCESTNLEHVGPRRTVGNSTSYFEAWRNAGSIMKNAKNFKSCINPPVFSADDDKKILDIIPPPELHLMLGVVNKIVSHMQDEFVTETTEWINLCNVQREFTQGGTKFNGNSCRILLKKVDSLRSFCSIGCLKYVETLKDFDRVVHNCFGIELNDCYKESIAQFKTSYLALGLSVTPKVHAVFYHIEDFCEGHRRGLGFYSEQAMETVHSDFKTMWNKYQVSENHPDYNDKLMKAVIEYNSYHI